MKMPPNMRSSMQKDVERGKTPELDAIAGPILRGAARHGIAVPATKKLVAAVERKSTPGQDCYRASRNPRWRKDVPNSVQALLALPFELPNALRSPYNRYRSTLATRNPQPFQAL